MDAIFVLPHRHMRIWQSRSEKQLRTPSNTSNLLLQTSCVQPSNYHIHWFQIRFSAKGLYRYQHWSGYHTREIVHCVLIGSSHHPLAVVCWATASIWGRFSVGFADHEDHDYLIKRYLNALQSTWATLKDHRAIVLLITMPGFVPCREVMTYYHI